MTFQQFLREDMEMRLLGQCDLTAAHCILDVACGRGDRLLSVAQAYPHLQCIGIDPDEDAIDAALEQAHTAGVKNVSFLVHDLATLDQLPFPHETFDVITIAFIAPYLLTLDYAALAWSLYSFCRPGETLCWTEGELPTTTSPACESLMEKTCQALQAAGHTFITPSMWDIAALFEQLRREAGQVVHPYERRTLGITPMLGSWLRHAGFLHISSTPYAIEVSAGTPAHEIFLQQVLVSAQRIKPFLLATGVISASAFDDLVEQMQRELRGENFSGLGFLLCVCGQKP